MATFGFVFADVLKLVERVAQKFGQFELIELIFRERGECLAKVLQVLHLLFELSLGRAVVDGSWNFWGAHFLEGEQ